MERGEGSNLWKKQMCPILSVIKKYIKWKNVQIKLKIIV